MTRDEFEELAAELDDHGKGLTAWEVAFLDGVLRQLDHIDWQPRLDQVETIQQIASERLT